MHRITLRLAVTAIALVTSMGARSGMAQEKPAIGELEAIGR